MGWIQTLLGLHGETLKLLNLDERLLGGTGNAKVLSVSVNGCLHSYCSVYSP